MTELIQRSHTLKCKQNLDNLAKFCLIVREASENHQASLTAQTVKCLPAIASARNAADPVSIPGLGRSPGEGNGNPLQYSCLENSMDGGAW